MMQDDIRRRGLIDIAIFSFLPVTMAIGPGNMKGLFALIIGLFVATGMVAGSMAHAAEMGGGRAAIASVSSCFNSPNEAKDGAEQGKSSPSEDGKSLVKFHACHGHHISVPVEPAGDEVMLTKVEILPAEPSSGLAPPTFIGTFRPPIA
ncbi:MAG: hypothetical protein WBF65_07395 [Sphingopyxis granuli]|jgi:hypothetical protein